MTIVAPDRGHRGARGGPDRGSGKQGSSRKQSPAPAVTPEQRFAQERLERARRRRAERIKRWLIASGIMASIVALGIGAWALAWRTNLLAIDEVRVVGIEGKFRQQAQDSALVPVGSPLIGLDAAGIATRVEALEWVRRATVRAAWPRGVVITVEPREALAREWSTGKLIDRDGTVFSMPGVDSRELPAVRADGAGRVDALKSLEYMPERLARRIELVIAASRDDIRFTLKDGAVVRWGSSEQGALKSEVLTALLQRRALVYDVSSPLTPTTRGERRAGR